MPPDWAPHARCWMAWPCREAAWGGGLDEARRAYADVAQAIVRFEPVTMIVRPELVAMASLYCGPGITVLPMAHDDSWARDTGPSFLLGAGGELGGVEWQFNGWGEFQPDHAQDAQMAARMLEHVGARRFKSELVLEGGAIHVDGEGTCLAAAGPLLDTQAQSRAQPRRDRSRTEKPARRDDGDLAAGRARRRRSRWPSGECGLFRPARCGHGADHATTVPMPIFRASPRISMSCVPPPMRAAGRSRC